MDDRDYRNFYVFEGLGLLSESLGCGFILGIFCGYVKIFGKTEKRLILDAEAVFAVPLALVEFRVRVLDAFEDVLRGGDSAHVSA